MYLYILTNTARSPEKSYIGITSRAVNRRLLEHFSTARNRPTHIAQALKKYGRDAFTLTILGQAESWEELCAMEQAAIVQYNTFRPHGYNLTLGGDGVFGAATNKGRTYSEAERLARQVVWDAMRGRVVSDDTRVKLSAKALEQFASQGNPMQGRKHSAETKAKIAAKRRGRPGWNKGKKMGPLSDETKAKLSAIHKGQTAWNKGIPWREITGGKGHPKARAVEYNGVVYPSVMACHVKTGLARNTIRLYIKQGKAKYMANIILTPAMAGTLEGPPMADAPVPAPNPADVFPRYGFSATEPGTPVVDSATGQVTCNSRLFESKAELDAAGGASVWALTPDAAAKASTPAPQAPVVAPEDDEEAPARRSHR